MLGNDYTVSLPVFSGPLDLLLRLIESEELDITTVALADVTDQYISHMAGMKEQRVEGLVDFLVLAARLLLIKSQALLPRAPSRGIPEEDPGAELARQLRMYRKFKRAANLLMNKQNSGLRTFVRLVVPNVVPRELDLSGYGVQDLTDAVNAALNRPRHGGKRVAELVGRPRFSVRGRIKAIARSLRSNIKASFFGILRGRRSRGEIVATFLAILELSRRNMVRVVQLERFGDIAIQRVGEWRVSDVEALDAELDSSHVETHEK